VVKPKDQLDTMKKEFHAMESKSFWQTVLMSTMPPGTKSVGYRWVHTEKRIVEHRDQVLYSSL
jgi:hypothetical protein